MIFRLPKIASVGSFLSGGLTLAKDEPVKKVSQGSEQVHKTNEAFKEVAISAEKVGNLVNEISAASNEQSEGIGQVNQAVIEMDKVVQSNAAGTEELSSQAEELNAQVGILLNIVEGQGGRIREKAATGKLSGTVERQESKALIVPKAKPSDRTLGLDDNFSDF